MEPNLREGAPTEVLHIPLRQRGSPRRRPPPPPPRRPCARGGAEGETPKAHPWVRPQQWPWPEQENASIRQLFFCHHRVIASGGR